MARREGAARLKTRKTVSAGGVVFQERDGDVEVVLCGRKDTGICGLPKGTPDAGETMEQAAVREVSEETGLQVEVVASLGDIRYWFVRVAERVRYDKTVYHYLMVPTGGDVSLHDYEYDFVEWFPIDEAAKRLSYGNEVEILLKAKETIAAGLWRRAAPIGEG